MFTIDSSSLYQETLKRERKKKTKVKGSEILWKIKIVLITRNT